MVLGPEEELGRGSLRFRNEDHGLRLSARFVSANLGRLWPNGIVPYSVDADLSEEQERILAAVEEWNAKTVIKLVARSTEPDYVRFRTTDAGNCRANVGAHGGEQYIWVPPNGCSVNAFVHEIGHAVGLWHEHEREDRDEWVMVIDGALDPGRANNYDSAHPADGPYDYASTMHYSLDASSTGRRPALETIPPGMPVPSAGLSLGDIDGVARLYGKPPSTTVVSTNPPNLEVVVDGIPRRAPVRFAWLDGSAHTIEAPGVQVTDGSRFLFGRWNLGGERQQTITAKPGSTWIEANFVVQHQVRSRTTPEWTGTVDLEPPSPDGYYTARTPIRAIAAPSPGSDYEFLNWVGVLSGQHGRATNPAHWIVDRPDRVFEAEFTTRPFLRIESDIEPFILQIGGYFSNEDYWTYAPTALRNDLDAKVRIGVDDVKGVPGLRHHRYEFRGWEDGGAITHWIAMPSDGGTLRADLEEQVRLSVRGGEDDRGAIMIEPIAEDGFYARGSSVRLTARPMPGWEFVRWTGSMSSFSPSISVTMDGPRHLAAEFSQTQRLTSERAEEVILRASNYRFEIFDAERGYRVHVPVDAVQLEVTFDARTRDERVDLYVDTGSEELVWNYGPDGRTPEFGAAFGSFGPSGSESVVIGAESTPPLMPGRAYYVSLVRFGSRTSTRGDLVARVRTSALGISRVRASPRAFTFVVADNSEVASQSMRLSNRGVGLLHYRLETSQRWLVAAPMEGVIDAGATQVVSIGVSAAGLVPDTYQVALWVAARVSDLSINPQRIEVPVAIIVLSPDGDGKPRPSVTSGEVISPRLLDKVEPEYTEEARRARLQGTVLLAIEVWEDGRAHNIRVLKGIGLGLDEKAVEAVRQWHFVPGMLNGVPVKVAAQVKVTFRLMGNP